MTDFVCDQGHRFHYSAKFTEHSYGEIAGDFLETQVCPFCQSKVFSEVQEADVANVLVVELTTGPQIAIDKALADGYLVVNRYAGKYVLEKPKAEKEKDYIEEATEAAKQ
jgi:hypothetical protein